MLSRARTRTAQHPVHIVHRIGAAVLGAVLWVFAGLGFAHAPTFLSTQGVTALGMSTNGALATISAVVGTAMLAAAAVGGRWASTLSAGFGALFLLSGLVHLGILNTQLNLLAFRLPNVLFSLVVGLVLLVLGLYGRVSGGLPPDNPYRRATPKRGDRPDPEEQLHAFEGRWRDDPDAAAHEQELAEAEMAMGEGNPTAEQARLVSEELAHRRAHERARAYRAQRDRDQRDRDQA